MSRSCSGLYDMRWTCFRSVVMFEIHRWLIMMLSSMEAVLSMTVATFELSAEARVVTLLSISSCISIRLAESDFHLWRSAKNEEDSS